MCLPVFSGRGKKAVKASWRSGEKAELKHRAKQSQNCGWSCRFKISGRGFTHFVARYLVAEYITMNVRFGNIAI